MTLASGARIGPLEIVGSIGAGGMGEVYRARDSRLNRDVAVKVLPAGLARDEERLRRFRLEAQTAGALNHPNILAVFDIGEHEGAPYIVTELLEGESLRERLRAGKLTATRAIDFARQIARGLAAAHAKGITHRDIKPDNLFVTRDGRLKILDFGLAKVAASTPGSTDGTRTFDTTPGTVLGTAGYMSPEQVRGQTADPRSDIFSLGCVLYEMLSGQQAFRGETAAETMNAILKEEPPDLPAQDGGLPPALERTVRRCLEKNVEERFQSAGDLAFSLETTLSGGPPALTSSPRASWPRRRTVTAVLLIVAAFGLGFFLRNAEKHSVPGHITFTQLTDEPGPELFPSLSPDGKSLVYAAKTEGNWDIYRKRVGGENPVNLTGESPDDDQQPAFSPDGEHIAFRSERDGGGIFVMGATGESVRRLTDFGYNPFWSPDGKEIICSTESIDRPELRQTSKSQVWSVRVGTGEEREIAAGGDAVQPSWSPHGHRIAYWASRAAGQRNIWTVPSSGGAPVPVTDDGFMNWNPIWSPDGASLFFSSDRGGSMNLWRVPVDEKSGKVLAEPEPVTTPSLESGHLTISRDGKRLAYVQRVISANLQKVVFDLGAEKTVGKPGAITQGSRQAFGPELSPNGDWLAFYSGGKQEDILVIRPDGTGLRQITDDRYKDRRPRWSPDGNRIAFHSNRSGSYEIWQIRPDGSGLQQVTQAKRGELHIGPVWSPDGKRLAYYGQDVGSFIAEPGAPSQPPRQVPGPAGGTTRFEAWSWSPDGRGLAGFKVNGAVRSGIAVAWLDSGKFESLTDFGSEPVWLKDNRRILFHHRGGLYLVDSASKMTHEVLSVSPHEVPVRGFTVSRDNRTIYFSLLTTEADIWMMNLE
jgi:eukaryotic-like serine/threonine-protein kinase